MPPDHGAYGTPLFATLPNGLRVVVTRLPHTHRTACTVHIQVGSRYEHPEVNGISHLL